MSCPATLEYNVLELVVYPWGQTQMAAALKASRAHPGEGENARSRPCQIEHVAQTQRVSSSSESQDEGCSVPRGDLQPFPSFLTRAWTSASTSDHTQRLKQSYPSGYLPGKPPNFTIRTSEYPKKISNDSKIPSPINCSLIRQNFLWEEQHRGREVNI